MLGITVGKSVDWLDQRAKARPYSRLFREPMNIPSAESLHILDNDLKTLEVKSSDGVKANIEQD